MREREGQGRSLLTPEQRRRRRLLRGLLGLPRARRRAWLARTGTQPGLVAALELEVNDAIGRDPRAALRVAELMREVGRVWHDRRAVACADHALAKIHHRAGRYPAAGALYTRAAAAFRALGLEAESNRARMHRVDALGHIGDATGAEREARRLLVRFVRAGDEVGAAQVLCQLANLRHSRDHHPDAIRLLERARPVLDAAGRRLDVAHVDMNLANSWSLLARFDRSGPLYARARRAYQDLAQPVWAAQVDYNDAYDHFLQGRLAEARRLLARAREAFRREGAAHHLALAALDESEMALAVSLPVPAEAAAREARRAFRAGGESVAEARAMLLEAQAARLAGKEQRARTLLAAARATFERVGLAAGVAAVDLARAASPALAPAERHNLALDAAHRFRQAGMAGKEATALVVAGAGALATGRTEDGRGLLSRALATARRRGLHEVELRAEHALGGADEDAGRTAAALGRYRRALGAYEKLRAGMRSDEDRLGFATDKSVVFESALRAALDLGRVSEVFDLVERARSRALADLLAGDARFAGSSLRLTPGLARRLDRLKRAILGFEARARQSERRAESLPVALAARLRQALAASEAAMDVLARQEPGVSYDLAGRPVVGLDELRGRLGPDRALLAYFAEEEHLGAILVTAGELRCERRITTVAAVERDLQALRFSLAQARAEGSCPAARARALAGAATEVLASLRVRLLGPLEGALGDHHLVVVPHAALQLVPFHALVRRGRPLVEEREVTSAPSATVLVRGLGRRPRTAGALVLAMADAAAPIIAREARVVGDLLGARMLIGPEATAAALRREGPNAALIHVAAHGVYESQEPLLSGLNLADGRLTLPEVATLALDAELVVLSACETGVGAPRGDEVLGLVRTFLHAGTRSLVASLWSVADASTADLMETFYRRHRGGDGVATALRAAVLAVRRAHPHPYHWAPFLAVGAWGPAPARPAVP